MAKIDFKNYDKPTAEDYSIPEAGIEDIDRAVFKLFDKDISFEIVTNNELTKVPVVFAAGERFALTRRKNPIRDNNNTIILPIISILRSTVDFSTSQGGRGSAITTRDQTSYTIKRRLAESDRDYQNLVNKFSIKNQDNVSSRNNFGASDINPGNTSIPGSFASRRQANSLKFSKKANSITLDSQAALGNNIFEIIQIPYPIFLTLDYKITFWTQYMSEMNEMQEIYLSNMKGQSEEFVVISDKGYEYVAKSSTTFSSDTNLSNYTDSERLIKCTFDIKVSGYILNSQNPGLPNQIRSFVSAPFIEFGYNAVDGNVVKRDSEYNFDRDVSKFTLSDVESNEEINADPNDLGVQRLVENPFTSEKEVKFLKILTTDQRSGETVISSQIIKKIDTQHE